MGDQSQFEVDRLLEEFEDRFDIFNNNDSDEEFEDVEFDVLNDFEEFYEDFEE